MKFRIVFLGLIALFTISATNSTLAQTTHEAAYGGGRDGALVITDNLTTHSRTAIILSQAMEGATSITVRFLSGQKHLEIGEEVFFFSRGTEGFRSQPNFNYISDVHLEAPATTNTAAIYLLTMANPFFSIVPSNQILYRVPHYTTVHVTSTGSLNPTLNPEVYYNYFIFRASESIIVDGIISAKGAGSPGGLGGGAGGFAGGWGSPTTENNHAGGGAGTSAEIPSGGGGGANGTPGQDGQSSNPSTIPPGQGGEVYGNPELVDVYDGAGGGSGQAINGFTNYGGRGGGFIFMAAPVVTLNGTLDARGDNGGDAYTASPPERKAGGGGGAGGTIWMQAEKFVGTGTLNASGGAGGLPSHEGDNLIAGGGGDGGDGRVRIDTPYGYPIGIFDIMSGTTHFGTYQAPPSDNRSNIWVYFE